MANDPPTHLPRPDDSVDAAIRWFAADTTHTRQALDHAGSTTPLAPGKLLQEARHDLHFEALLPDSSRVAQLAEAQATWLINRFPRGHARVSIDSAQQAGRAWGVLIAADAGCFPGNDVLAAVIRRTGLPAHAAAEITAQARATSMAYNRADLDLRADHVHNEVLAADWQQMAACGLELPEAADKALQLLELLGARESQQPQFRWLTPAVDRVARVLHAAARAQPLLVSLTRMLPTGNSSVEKARQAEMVKAYEMGLIELSLTAAARAHAVNEWAKSAPGLRAHALSSAGPRMRTLLDLEHSLGCLRVAVRGAGPSPRHPAEGSWVGEVAAAVDRLAVTARSGGAVVQARTARRGLAVDLAQRHQRPAPGAAPRGPSL
ncbi:hypothetical protein OIE69_44005 (plasmid) [Actinacidiphila glaucinigra]|uniref:hypothetical protein n=1 Tax=Actinacidiphila glaucinigra TaxID=235986 RepID=UPI002DD8D61E|nr:hypothetical protein [Actinacidiphila glaucinigra]WSD65870.1 hypothetical protein OIE69_44005 [Actinacidiphila glaucinigra]